jgi:hypothetical protein
MAAWLVGTQGAAGAPLTARVVADEVITATTPSNNGASPMWCAWADFSADRFSIPVVGTVSRDGKYLAAIATGAAASLCQAWHDCMHLNSNWGGPDGRTWRLKVYVMENDPAKLLAAVARDFSERRPE